MHNIFRNRTRQLRAGWEILLVAAAIFVLTMLMSFGLSLRVNSRQLFDPDGWVRVFKSSGLYMLIVVCFTVRVIRRQPLSTIGLSRPDVKQFAQGFLSGALLMAIIVMVLWGLGNAAFQNDGWTPRFSQLDLPGLMVTACIAGICEEVLFRGYIQHLLASRLGTVWAVVITSVIFSAAHMANPGYNWISALNIVLIALIFSYATLRTGNLYYTMALHLSWNLVQGYGFGVSVSGNTQQGLYSVMLEGPDWITGGSFGLEASILTTILLGLICAGLLLVPVMKQRGRTQQTKISIR
ncbi:CPBP family intramembrane glutamic endopeptidase [Paenibacillus sonchi]|uniref:CPBP family intramembrane glutamic endopeptidase n=1 Tax=Paenibacillus sonchi TaxID=373687 RepID=UPI001E653FD2|nr:CPBP family intramembrane metalloprotease [Paenibacillus sonchi]